MSSSPLMTYGESRVHTAGRAVKRQTRTQRWLMKVIDKKNALLVVVGVCLLFVAAFAGYIITEPVKP